MDHCCSTGGSLIQCRELTTTVQMDHCYSTEGSLLQSRDLTATVQGAHCYSTGSSPPEYRWITATVQENHCYSTDRLLLQYRRWLLAHYSSKCLPLNLTQVPSTLESTLWLCYGSFIACFVQYYYQPCWTFWPLHQLHSRLLRCCEVSSTQHLFNRTAITARGWPTNWIAVFNTVPWLSARHLWPSSIWHAYISSAKSMQIQDQGSSGWLHTVILWEEQAECTVQAMSQGNQSSLAILAVLGLSGLTCGWSTKTSPRVESCHENFAVVCSSTIHTMLLTIYDEYKADRASSMDLGQVATDSHVLL